MADPNLQPNPHNRILLGLQHPQPAPNLPQDLISIPEAAEILKVAQCTLRLWVRKKLIPAWQVGPKLDRNIRVSLATVVRPFVEVETANNRQRKEKLRLAHKVAAERRARMRERLAKKNRKPLPNAVPVPPAESAPPDLPPTSRDGVAA